MMLLLKPRADKQFARLWAENNLNGPLVVVVVVDLSILHIYSITGPLGWCGR